MSNGNSFIMDRLKAAFSKVDQFETISGPPPRQSVREFDSCLGSGVPVVLISHFGFECGD